MATELTAERLASLRKFMDARKRLGGNFILVSLWTAEDLLRAAEERNGMERERDACCDDYQKEAIRAHAAEQERDSLRAENETLRKRAVECMPMLETLREALGTDLGSGGGFVSVLDGIDRLRAQRDALVAAADRVVRRSREIEWTEPNEGGLRQRAMESTVEDIVALREAIRAAKENQ